MNEQQTVGEEKHSRGMRVVVGALVVLGLALLNADWIGRNAVKAAEALWADDVHAPQHVVVTPAPDAEPITPVAHAPASRATAGAGTDAATVPAEARPTPGAASTDAPAPPPLARLYPMPPSGREGLVALVRSGVLRPASGADLAYWKMRYASNNPGGIGPGFDEHIRRLPAYVVLGDMEIPGGLSGANAVAFILDTRAPFPTGDPGHSVILDPAGGTCTGAICRMLLRD
ncbi:hypothetical protein [Pseudoxanthomonas sp. Soil82]|uniref:hypothetical protein n=1 Tax=Pseudoxanthomonas sp. Soil82 TaxID=3157341 RepID=UPI00338F2DD3